MKKEACILLLFLMSSMYVFGQDSLSHSRNMKSVGILVGSGLIGIDYEQRVNDALGIQGGLGLLGCEASANLHFNASAAGAYISLAYKNIGFGTLSTIGPEFGNRWLFGETESWGIVVRLGVGKVLSTDEKFKIDFMRDHNIAEFPKAVLTYAIGICF